MHITTRTERSSAGVTRALRASGELRYLHHLADIPPMIIASTIAAIILVMFVTIESRVNAIEWVMLLFALGGARFSRVVGISLRA
jgi:uncharacterized protein (DUF983 family)